MASFQPSVPNITHTHTYDDSHIPPPRPQLSVDIPGGSSVCSPDSTRLLVALPATLVSMATYSATSPTLADFERFLKCVPRTASRVKSIAKCLEYFLQSSFHFTGHQNKNTHNSWSNKKAEFVPCVFLNSVSLPSPFDSIFLTFSLIVTPPRSSLPLCLCSLPPFPAAMASPHSALRALQSDWTRSTRRTCRTTMWRKSFRCVRESDGWLADQRDGDQ